MALRMLNCLVGSNNTNGPLSGGCAQQILRAVACSSAHFSLFHQNFSIRCLQACVPPCSIVQDCGAARGPGAVSVLILLCCFPVAKWFSTLFSSAVKSDLQEVHNCFVSASAWQGWSHICVAPGATMVLPGSERLDSAAEQGPPHCPRALSCHASSSGMCDHASQTHGFSEGFLNTLLSSS